MKLFKLPTKKVIYGCESRGDGDKPYLTRITLIDRADRWQLCLHVFHRSDHDTLHDHPWAFHTLVLWRGYTEHFLCVGHPDEDLWTESRRIRPLTWLYRSEKWTHRVKLHRDREGRELPAVTLCIMGPRVREWGFRFLDGRWQQWREYFREMGC